MYKYLIHILFCLCLQQGYSQISKTSKKKIKEDLSFYLLDVESGLSNNFINSIEQDSLGFIWVATPSGLNRYDGTQFVSYKKNNGDSLSISNNYIETIKLIKDGKLIMATLSGLNIYDPKKEKFDIIDDKDGLIGNNISSLYCGVGDNYILGINYKGVQIVKENKVIKTFSHDPNNVNSLSSNEISSITEQGDSLLWIGTSNKGLNKINYKTNNISRIPYGKNTSLPSSIINALYTDKDGNLWIGSKEGLQVITTKGDTLSLKKSASNIGLSDDNVLCFEEDNNGQLWVGTRNGGLNIFNKSDFLSQRQDFSVIWYLPKDDGSSVYNRTVSALKMDFKENMWIGTSTGINFVNPRGEPINLLQRNIAYTETLSHNRIGALSNSKDGNIWIGTDGAGLDLFNPKTGDFKHYKHDPNNPFSLSNNYIISLYEDKKSRLWVGTYQGGLNKMNPTTGYCKRYLQGSIIDGSDVRVIYEDILGNIWVGTNRGGLYKYEDSKDLFEYIDSLGKIDIRCISEDKTGNLWLATYGDGIIKYNPNSKEITNYNSDNTKGLNTNIIFSLLTLSDGDLLIGTHHEGLIRFSPTDKNILSFKETDGLSNNSISSIIIESDNDIWLGSYKGISHYNSKTHEIYNLNTYNNIQQSEFSIGSALKSKNGILYFGGNKGLNFFNPNNLENKEESYSIIFEDLEVFNEKVSVLNNKKILDKSISYADNIKLNHNQTLFSINYVALKYPFIKNVNYSYRLDDYHNHWISTDNSGKVNLTNIPPGEYNLKVKAELGFGDEITKDISIIITPPFWKTPIAYVIYLILAVSILLGIMKYYSERVKLINSLIFEKKQRQLEHDFNEERIRFFTSFSHELKTPLTLIIAPLEDLLFELKTKKHKDRVKLIYKNSKHLLQSINKLLEFRKSNLSLSKLVAGKYDISEHLEQWVNNYNPLAQKKKINLSFSKTKNDFIVWVDLEKLNVVINNLLSNAFKHTQEKGEIQVGLSYESDNFIIKVRDNGAGIKQNELEHIFDWYYQSGSKSNKSGAGIGLALSKNFVELHNGSIHVESEHKKGTSFTISIPRDRSLLTNTINNEKNIKAKKQIKKNNLQNVFSEFENYETPPPNIHANEEREVILLIDDNSNILEYLNGLLDDTYDLIYANDGKEGVEKALNYIPDLIISDIMMPKIDGIDLCNILKKEMATTHIPIILLSAKDNVESIKSGYDEGADDYIVKPFNSQLLKTRIRNLLNNRKQLRNYFLKEEELSPAIIDEKSKLLDREKTFLSKLEEIVLSHINKEKTSVEKISQSMGMSRTSLFRKIKAITGFNINQYITRIKINKAAELIKTKNITISQASYEVGFSNVKYFRKLFKEQFGMLPSELLKTPSKKE